MSKPTLTTGGRGGRYWYGSYTDHAGQRRRVSLGPVSGIPTATAQATLDKIVRLDNASQPSAGKPPNVLDWLDQYAQVRPDHADATRELYRQAVKHLTDHAGNVRIDQLTRQQAATYPPYLIGLGLTPATANKHARCIRALLAEAVDQDIIKRNPFKKIRTPGQVESTFDYVSTSSLDQMLDACPGHTWRTLIGLSRLAGLRLGEARRLSWTDIDWQAHTLTVKAKTRHRTTKDKTRTLPIMPQLYEILMACFEAGYPGPVGLTKADFEGGTSAGYATMQQIIKQAELPQWAKPFHTLRKSLESDWLSTYPVMDVARWLGHSPTVAAQHYHQTTPDTLARVTGQQADKDKIIADLREQIEALTMNTPDL